MSFDPVRSLHRYRNPVEFEPVAGTTAIGVVVPYDFNLDWEYWQYIPPGAVLHFTRTPALRMEVGIGLARRVGRPSVVARATSTLRAVQAKAFLYACTSGSFVGGVRGDREIQRAMVAAGAPRAVTSGSAVVDALRLTGMQRVATVTPYTSSLSRKLAEYLDEAGFETVSTYYLGLTKDIANVSQATVADLVRQADHDSADAVYVSCTALRTFGIVSQLEAELGRPVFTANQVSLWAVLVAAGVLPRPADVEPPAWTLGGPAPMAYSSRLLMEAAAQRPQIGVVPDLSSVELEERPEGGLASGRAG